LHNHESLLKRFPAGNSALFIELLPTWSRKNLAAANPTNRNQEGTNKVAIYACPANDVAPLTMVIASTENTHTSNTTLVTHGRVDYAANGGNPNVTKYRGPFPASATFGPTRLKEIKDGTSNTHRLRRNRAAERRQSTVDVAAR
jgi:hypothetical protein